jgi:hypothetical protein
VKSKHRRHIERRRKERSEFQIRAARVVRPVDRLERSLPALAGAPPPPALPAL